MKTNTYYNMIRTILLASFFSVVLLSQNAYATNDLILKSKAEIEVSKVEFANEISSYEDPLNLEDWMVSSNHWEIPAEFNTEIDTKIELWMTNSSHFINSEYTQTEKLEPWMLNPCHWIFVSTDVCEIKIEENYHIHEWMKNPDFFRI